MSMRSPPSIRRPLSKKNSGLDLDPSRRMARRTTWIGMTEKKASCARLDSAELDDGVSNGVKEDSVYEKTVKDILNPSRLAALDAVDVAPIPYNTYSFFSYILTIRGRNFPMMIAPLVSLFLWGLGWELLFYLGEKSGNEQIMDIQEYLITLDGLITPLLTPLSFLMTFRLGRAAVRFWDARAAIGMIVAVCRSNITTITVGVMGPIRKQKKREHKKSQDKEVDDEDNRQTQQYDAEKKDDDDEVIELLCEYARWMAAFPIAVKHFIRGSLWEREISDKKRRYEIGPLLSDEDAAKVIKECDDNKTGEPTADTTTGTRVRDPPLVVLNRLQELAYDICHFAYSSNGATPQSQAIIYQQVMEQLDVLFQKYGTMERIKGTPLPFVYAIHLRTFLILYLFLWWWSSVAKYEWISLPFLLLLSWALLGIEAASVECERPFDYNPNHLTLGKVCVLVARNIGQALKELVGSS